MKHLGSRKNPDRKTIPGILSLIAGLLGLAYFGMWAAGLFIWSFDIGVQFILACGVLLTAFGILLLHGGIVRWFRKHRVLRAFFVAAASLFLLSFAVIEGLILSDTARNDSDVRADFVIIPGAIVVEDRPSLVLKHRMDGAVPYLRANPGAVVIVSGAKGGGETYSEAEVMKRYLVGEGIQGDRIVKEEKAMDTVGNIAYSKEIIDGYKLDHTPKVMIVTNDYHMFRALLLAKHQGLEAYGITRRIYFTVAPISYCREYFSLVKLFLTGLRSE
jgi:uncharacterized SAM-binding protein YcdF (DUF218 family)